MFACNSVLGYALHKLRFIWLYNETYLFVTFDTTERLGILISQYSSSVIIGSSLIISSVNTIFSVLPKIGKISVNNKFSIHYHNRKARMIRHK